jgi:hypothetical protein
VNMRLSCLVFPLQQYLWILSQYVGTHTIRAYDTTSAPGSAVATPSADAGTVTADASVDASAGASARAAGRSRCANAASYASAARRALKLPARMASMMT